MKILHLIYTTGIAGAEKYLENLLPGLKNYNIECHLICVCPQTSVDILKSYCQLMNAREVPTTLMVGAKQKFLSIAKNINNYLQQENIHVLHTHLSNADLLAVIVKRIYNKKIYIASSKHGYDERYLIKYKPNAEYHQIDRNLYYYFTKFLLKNIDVNLAVSKAISDLYFNIKLSSNHYDFIKHGIAMMPQSNIKKIKNQIVISGRLKKMKGHKYLFDAMPEVVRRIPSVHLLVIGDGIEKNNLTKQAQERGISNAITFMGFQPDPDIYIQQSEVIILPSLFEPFGLVYIEAFALKIPVVAFDVPACNEIISNNETGLLVQKFDTAMLAEKIIYLLKQSEERDRLSENAYREFLKYYTAERMVGETAKWYNSLNFSI